MMIAVDINEICECGDRYREHAEGGGACMFKHHGITEDGSRESKRDDGTSLNRCYKFRGTGRVEV